jgi:hypothetical protein
MILLFKVLLTSSVYSSLGSELSALLFLRWLLRRKLLLSFGSLALIAALHAAGVNMKDV